MPRRPPVQILNINDPKPKAKKPEEPPAEKVCSFCGEKYTVEDFYPNRNETTGLRRDKWCKKCYKKNVVDMDSLRKYMFENGRLWTDSLWEECRNRAEKDMNASPEYASIVDEEIRKAILLKKTLSIFPTVMNNAKYYRHFDPSIIADNVVDIKKIEEARKLTHEISDPYDRVPIYSKKWGGRYTQAEIDSLVARSPYAKATSNDIDWLAKVEMQGRIQKWVDHSISVTINLPNNVDEKLVNDLYVTAWKCGCKGCTVYRDGSRAGVLVSTDSKKEKKEQETVKPAITEVRPTVLKADVVRFQNNKEKWVAFIGLLDGEPYEIFTGQQDDEDGIPLPKNVTQGIIIKHTNEDGSKRYDFQFENKIGYKTTIEGLSERFNPEFWNYAKLISGVLRYKMPIEQVIKLISSLELASDNINTWKNGVERALKRYIKDGTSTAEKCPNCKQPLIFEEGCLHCPGCGYSKCG